MTRPIDPTRKSPYKKKRKEDPRVALFKAAYCDPHLPTFGNCKQSAIAAGYTEQYADTITARLPKWLEELLQDDEILRADMLKRAQRNLKSVVEEKKPDNVSEKKLWIGVNQFVSGTLGKDFFSTRQELTGKDGKRLFSIKDESREKTVDELFKGVQSAPTSTKTDK